MSEYVIMETSGDMAIHPTFKFKGIRMSSPVFSNYFEAVRFLVMLQNESSNFNDFQVYEVEIQYTFVR